MEGRDRLIVALDVPALADAEAFAERLGQSARFYKIGLELYAAEGRRALAAIGCHGRLFLDLKLHDIPETVARTVHRLGGLGVDLLTVHASGGVEMMRRAAEAAHTEGMRVLAVTVLTSLDVSDLAKEGYSGALADLALARAQLAAQAGCDGAVASPLEVRALRAALPPPFLLVTPGVRPAGAAPPKPFDDQKRVATPGAAIADGADHVVVGRPLRDAPDPAALADAIVREMGG